MWALSMFCLNEVLIFILINFVYLQKAYDDNDCEMLLIALCGYGMETISNNRRESTE